MQNAPDIQESAVCALYQFDKLVFVAQPIVGRAHEPADQVCSLSGWLNGIGSDETVGMGPILRNQLPGQRSGSAGS